MTQEEIALREKAMKATPGPYTIWRDKAGCVYVGTHGQTVVFLVRGGDDNAEYVKASQPLAILALLAKLEDLEHLSGRLQEELKAALSGEQFKKSQRDAAEAIVERQRAALEPFKEVPWFIGRNIGAIKDINVDIWYHGNWIRGLPLSAFEAVDAALETEKEKP